MIRSKQKNVSTHMMRNSLRSKLKNFWETKSFQNYQNEIPEYRIELVCLIYKQMAYSQAGSFIYTNVFTLQPILMQKTSLVFVFQKCFCHRTFRKRKIWIRKKTVNSFKDFRLLMENAKLMSNLNLIEPKRSKSLLAIMFLLDLDQTLAWCVGRLI